MYSDFKHNDLCIGIDLGTTNSVLATVNEKPNGDIVSKVVDIQRAVDVYSTIHGEAKLTTEKKPTLPSCVYYREEKNYEPLVGDVAKRQYQLRPHLVAKSIKSQMGKPFAEGLSPDIPDKTPAEIASVILKHMLKEASRVYRCEINDAVITVPANFDSVMCKATRDAAELAGIKVRNDDGSEIPVLLSEPNAVIYDLINQIHNGEISNRILDLSNKRRVLVFDLGGGTLDITMHEIQRRDDESNILKVDEIATNRYTLLGGDDFDEIIAETMYKRYLKNYSSYPDVVVKLKQDKKVIMPQLRVYAENLKLDLSERGNCSEDYNYSGWDDEEDEKGFSVGGHIGGIGYSYDDTFTKEEIENILSDFMASDLVFDDYKNIDNITNTRNIIYPILDVLNKAAEKFKSDDVTVDAVIVNGGMSKFYMITDRLKKFFGFEPIIALDPDQSVARGAAVCHYYLHKYAQLQDDMRMLGEVQNKQYFEEKKHEPYMAIQWGNNILNDSLYLGVKNGAVHMIIPTGAELPYTSEIMTGFKVEAGQKMISVPIKSKNNDGSYRTIATGKISFKNRYSNGAYVAFVIRMGSNKVITMTAWTSVDADGIKKIEEGYVEIAIDTNERLKIKSKFVAPSGSILQPSAEISNLLQLCKNYEQNRNIHKNKISKRIASNVNNICNAGNKNDFAEIIIETLNNTFNQEAKKRLFTISRKIGDGWSENQKKMLAKACINQISADLHGMSANGIKISTNIQAIYTLSMCANAEQVNKLSALHESSKYLQSCMYAHAKTCTSVDWLEQQFYQDVKKVKNQVSSNIQFSSYSIGLALKKDIENSQPVSINDESKIVKSLCEVLKSRNITSDEINCCIIALGCICDQRKQKSNLSEKILDEVNETIMNIEYYYPSDSILSLSEKAREVAIKMVHGVSLSEDEEEFLLTKLEQ